MGDNEKKPIQAGNAASLLDLKAEFFNRKRDAKRAQLTSGVQIGKVGVLTVTKHEKAARREKQERRRQNIERCADLVRKEEAERDRQRKTMEEKAKLYDKMTNGEEVLYDDGTRAEFLVNFHAKKREIEDADDNSRSPRRDERPDDEPGTSRREKTPPLILHYDHTEDKGRIFGPSHLPLSHNEDERSQEIKELKNMTKETEVIRKKRKKQMDEKKRAEREKAKRLRVKLNLPPISSSSEESESDAEIPGPSLDDIPLPTAASTIEKPVKYGSSREWDKEKFGHNRWISQQRDKRDEDFAPPKSYYSRPIMQNHRAELEKIAKDDPEFYKFLKDEEADLLDFNDSDIEEEVDGDLSDEEKEQETQTDVVQIGRKSIALKLDNQERKIANQRLCNLINMVLSNPIENRTKLPNAVETAVRLFQACATRVGADTETPEFVINDDKLFDEVVRTCLKNMGPCLLLLLQPQENKSTKENKTENQTVVFKHWKRYRTLTRQYLSSLIDFIGELGQSNVLIATIRSTLSLSDLFVHFPIHCRRFTKFLIQVWSRKSMEERCMAFLVLNRLCRAKPDLFPHVYKSCYIAYVTASRSIHSGSWPSLLFMQKSFAELTYLFPEAAYEHVFVFIRQFAIHLRNAKIAKRKDVVKMVYNWQYVLGLYLWSTVMIRARRHFGESEAVDWIRELLYPLIQITIGLINVFAVPRYVPLRLHCIRILLQLQVTCKVYIPTLSLSSDLLSDLIAIDVKPPSHSKVLQKTTEIRNLIRLTREMLDDVNYRRLVAKEIFELFSTAIEVLKDEPAFLEVYSPVKLNLKTFAKECMNVEHKKIGKGTRTEGIAIRCKCLNGILKLL
ncbi:hypothetical protein M3Y98_00929500 [Aphelenchoides besseyi]|nr:hypothetical protein M3Y98_00929500 [Aphelenchoides besseyi]